MVQELFPLCKDTVRIKKYPSCCWAEELMYDTSFRLAPIQAFLFMLCKGDTSLSSIIYIIDQLFDWNHQNGLTAKEYVAEVFRKYRFCFDFLETPLREGKKLCYDAESFLYIPTTDNNGEHFDSPASMTLVLTKQCNFRCIYCFNDSGKPVEKKELTTEEWLSVIRQAADLGVIKCSLTGGEPLMHPGFFPILEELHKHHIITYICSNGSLMTEENVARLKKLEQPLVQISMDSPSSQTHDMLTMAKGSLARVIEGIKRLVAAGITVYIKSLVLPDTIDEVPALIDLCIDLGVTNLVLDRYDLCYHGRGTNRFFLTRKQEERLELLVSNKKKEINDKLNISLISGSRNWETKEDIVACGAFMHSFTVMPNGDYPVCEKTEHMPEFIIGQFPNQSLSDMWNSPRINEVLSPPRESYKEPCSSCEQLAECKTGCFAAKNYFEDSQYGPDPKCFKASYENNYFLRSEE